MATENIDYQYKVHTIPQKNVRAFSFIFYIEGSLSLSKITLYKIESVALIPVFGGAYNSLCVFYYMYKHTMYLFWEVDNIFAIYAP